MKTLGLVIVAVILMSASDGWLTDFSKATEKAKEEHKYILLTFTGSDWCGPCIRTKKEIFDNGAFISHADSCLVLINADFPRMRKNMLTSEQVKKNEALAQQYNKAGAFPHILLFNPDGKVVKEWTGYAGVSAKEFISELRSLEHGK